jgi:hypothetical protein
MKLKGAALYYSIIIILLSSTTIGLILLSSFYQNKFLIDTFIKDQLEQDVFSAFNLVKGGQDIFYEKDKIIIDLFNDSIDLVEITKKRWGAYSIVTATARQKRFLFSKRALIGSDMQYEEPIALFVPDEGRIVSFSGSTLIKGTSYLPQKVARAASIEGQPFIYKEMTLGGIKPSPKSLPIVNNDIFQFAEHYFQDGYNENDSIIDVNSLDSLIVKNSFENKTLIIICQESTNLSKYSFSGNIIIWSVQPITFYQSTQLQDVIIFAPSIIIKNGFSGTFQAYALQSITVGTDCNLKFPTLLNIIPPEEKYNLMDSLKIIIGRRTRIDGGIMIKSSGLKSYLKIASTAKVVGQVYVPGNIELLGEVTGSVYCKSFFLLTSRARYENHLLNCKVDRLSLSTNYVGLDLFNSNPYRSIIRWLN